MYKKPKFSSIIDTIIPVFLIAIIMAFILLSNQYTSGIRDKYTSDFMSIFDAIIEEPCDGYGGINKTAVSIIEHINSLDGKSAVIYLFDEEINDLVPYTSGKTLESYRINPDYAEFDTLLKTEESGYFMVKALKTEFYVHFQWFTIDAPSCTNRYLIVYAIDQGLFEQPLVTNLRYVAVLIFMAYWLKVNFYDRSIYMKILQGTQKRIISKFEYTRIEAAMYDDGKSDDQKIN